MVTEKGTISINTENIFPIIKKFLYSDHEIFLRELVSNAVDATQKIKKLSSIGQFDGELGDLKNKVSFDKDAKTITISDKGLGMTADEIKKYINQIAFSGAKEFVEKYKDESDKGFKQIEDGEMDFEGHVFVCPRSLRSAAYWREAGKAELFGFVTKDNRIEFPRNK